MSAPSSEKSRVPGWRTEEWYRVLSYYFCLRSNSDAFQGYPQKVLRTFAVMRDVNEERRPPTPGLPPSYMLVEMPPPQPLRFRVLYEGEMLFGSDLPGPVVDHFFWHVNSEAIRQTGDLFLIHAGAVTVPGQGALLLPGASGSGKSTLVVGLVLDGFDYLSDEAAAIDPVTRRVHPYARAISLRPDVMLDVFPNLVEREPAPGMSMGHWRLLPTDLRADCVSEPSRVRWLVMPKFQGEVVGTEVEPITRGQAAMELGRNSMSSARYGSRALALLADLVSGADCYRIRYGTHESAIATIRHLTGLEN